MQIQLFIFLKAEINTFSLKHTRTHQFHYTHVYTHTFVFVMFSLV